MATISDIPIKYPEARRMVIERCEEMGMTLSEACAQAGLYQQIYRDWTRGKGKPERAQLSQLVATAMDS